MSDMSSGARAPDLPYPTEREPAYPSATSRPSPGAGLSPDDDQSAPKRVAQQAVQAAGQATGDVKDTVKEQAHRVGAEAKTQARHLASEVRDRVSDQARTQNGKLVDTIRQTADHLDEMRGQRADSPAATVVARVADGGRQIADYLDRNGPDGVLREVQDFARRRPGAFLATALAAGFVVGRLGKGVAKADSDAGESKPASDSFVSHSSGNAYPAASSAPTDYSALSYSEPNYSEPSYDTYQPATTEYAATGTGTPLVVDEEYDLDRDSRGGRR